MVAVQCGAREARRLSARRLPAGNRLVSRAGPKSTQPVSGPGGYTLKSGDTPPLCSAVAHIPGRILENRVLKVSPADCHIMIAQPTAAAADVAKKVTRESLATRQGGL